MQEKLSFLADTSLSTFTCSITPLFKSNTISFILPNLALIAVQSKNQVPPKLTIACLSVYFCCFNKDFVDSAIILLLFQGIPAFLEGNKNNIFRILLPLQAIGFTFEWKLFIIIYNWYLSR